MQKEGKERSLQKKTLSIYSVFGAGGEGRNRGGIVYSVVREICVCQFTPFLAVQRERERERRGRIGLSINTASKG